MYRVNGEEGGILWCLTFSLSVIVERWPYLRGLIMSNSLLESLWARVSANIGDRIEQINGLLTQALSANTESIAARDGAVTAAGDAATSDRKSVV